MTKEKLGDRSSWKTPKERVNNPVIQHGGKHPTVDMGMSPDLVTGSTDPLQILKEMRRLARINRSKRK